MQIHEDEEYFDTNIKPSKENSVSIEMRAKGLCSVWQLEPGRNIASPLFTVYGKVHFSGKIYGTKFIERLIHFSFPFFRISGESCCEQTAKIGRCYGDFHWCSALPYTVNFGIYFWGNFGKI